jgi:hypothetical protein
MDLSAFAQRDSSSVNRRYSSVVRNPSLARFALASISRNLFISISLSVYSIVERLASEICSRNNDTVIRISIINLNCV